MARALGTAVARPLHTGKVAGSIPASPTTDWLTAKILREPKSATEGYVYFIACGGYVKVGYSSVHPKRRLVAMRILNPRPCKIIGVLSGGTRLEGYVHEMMDKVGLRHRNEWFHLNKGSRALLDAIRKRHAEGSLPASTRGAF